MTWAVVSAAAFAVVLIAAGWPYLRLPASPGLTATKRADWVNRLFVLAAQADEAGQAEVASAARGLTSALIGSDRKATR